MSFLIILIILSLIFISKANFLLYLNTTVIDYKYSTIEKSYSSCCLYEKKCRNVCSKPSACFEKCDNVCVKDCKYYYDVYNIYTINKYYLLNENKTNLRIENTLNENDPNKNTCEFKTYSEVSELDKYMSATKNKYPINYNISLYLDYKNNLCYTSSFEKVYYNVKILLLLLFINIFFFVFIN
jgi:hypothetical protein